MQDWLQKDFSCYGLWIIFSKLLLKKTFNTVRNIIAFTIVFTNKNGMDRFNPPPSKLRLNKGRLIHEDTVYISSFNENPISTGYE